MHSLLAVAFWGVFSSFVPCAQASPAPSRAIGLPVRTASPEIIPRQNLAGLNLNPNVDPLDVDDEPTTPTGQGVVPPDNILDAPQRLPPPGSITCQGNKPDIAYPYPFTYDSFSSVQKLCASRLNGGYIGGNMGGFCNDDNQVQFAAHSAHYALYNVESLHYWCRFVCFCPRDRTQSLEPYINGAPIRISDNIHMVFVNHILNVVLGPNPAQPLLTSLTISEARPTRSVSRSLDFDLIATASPTPTGDSGGGVGPPGTYYNRRTSCQRNSDCSSGSSTGSSGTCGLGDTAGTRYRACDGVCQVTESGPGSWQVGQDPVFYPGVCIAAITWSALNLIGRDVQPAANASNSTYYPGVAQTVTLLGNGTQINVTKLHCGCNDTFVAKDCCAYPDGLVPGNASQRLGHVEPYASI